MSLTCKVCNKPFERSSRKGPPPKTCPACKLAARQAKGRAVREKYDTRPLRTTTLTATTTAGDNVVVSWNDEPSWLDSPEIQEKLAERNQAKAEPEREHEIKAVIEPEPVEHVNEPLPSDVVKAEPEVDLMPYADEPRDMGLLPEVEEVVGPEQDSHCVAPWCHIPVVDHQFAGKFCAGHWRLLDLGIRGVLLGSEPGSPVFEQTVQRAVRSLR